MYLPVAASSDLIDRRSRGPGTQSSPSTSVSPEHHYSVFNANQMNSNQMGTVPPQQAAYWYTQDGGNTANPQLGQYGYNQLQSAGHPQYGTMPYPMAAPQPSLYSPYASTSTWANQPYYTSAPQATYATETVPGNCSSGNYSQYGQDQITSAIWTDHTNEYHQTCGNISRGYDGSSAEYVSLSLVRDQSCSYSIDQ